MSELVAVAGLSARALAEAARRDGLRVFALDLFGDLDTRAAAEGWAAIGDAQTLQVDASALRDGLHAARDRGARRWVAGSGFDGRVELLEAAEAVLPRAGTPLAPWRCVRDPAAFFGVLDSHGIAHPPVRLDHCPAGWLLKDSGGCGGWHIRVGGDADDGALPQGHYAQQRWPGRPASATFLSNGIDATLLGFNWQIVRPLGDMPFAFHGVIGPVPAPDGLNAVVRGLAAAFALRGLGSVDLLLDGGRMAVLEVNPRPPASAELYPAIGLAAHLRACAGGPLPAAPADGLVHGRLIVYAPRDLEASLPRRPWVHDRPADGTPVGRDQPLCTVSADGADDGVVEQCLAARAEAVLHGAHA